MTPIANRFPDSILEQELGTSSTSSQETRASSPPALSQLCDPQKARTRHPRTFLSSCLCNSWSEGAVYATPESRLQIARSMKLKSVGLRGRDGENLITSFWETHKNRCE